MALRGADPAVVRDAIASGDPLPGTRGFAGRLDAPRPDDVSEDSVDDLADDTADEADHDSRPVLVRDALGREPLYVEAGTGDGFAGNDAWAFDPTALDRPEPLPAGSVRDAEGPVERWPLPEATPAADPDAALASLRSAIDGALADALGPDPGTPVAFSGGVDSGLVASATDGPLYVAGFPEANDVAAAREAAAALGRDLRVVELDHATLERAVVEVARAMGRSNAMDVAIAVPLYLVAECAAADGHERLAVGQGADECFGGYAKVARAPGDDRVHADTVLGARDEVLRSLPAQLPRDVLAIRAAGVEPVAPLLDDRVVAAALSLRSEQLVSGDRRKVALREVAGERLPRGIAERGKKALQYGSLVSRELDRLARRAGFKRRMDDHVQRYVAELCED